MPIKINYKQINPISRPLQTSASGKCFSRCWRLTFFHQISPSFVSQCIYCLLAVNSTKSTTDIQIPESEKRKKKKEKKRKKKKLERNIGPNRKVSCLERLSKFQAATVRFNTLLLASQYDLHTHTHTHTHSCRLVDFRYKFFNPRCQIQTRSVKRFKTIASVCYTTPLVELMYLVFTRMPSESGSGLCCCVCVTSFER